jgi:hypothetical protein
MRTITTTVYSYDELTEQAQEEAREQVRKSVYDSGFFWINEAMETFREFADLFDIDKWEIDFENPYRNSYRLNLDADIRSLSGQRLATYLWNNYKSDLFKGKYYGKLVNTHKDGQPIEVSKEHPARLRHVKRYSNVLIDHSCVLTGVCYDNDMLKPIYEFLECPDGRDFQDLIEDCISSICTSVQNEIEYNLSDKGIEEEIECNNYEFDEEGNIY